MKANIFTAADYTAIIARINRLTPQSIRQWGKMTLPQMLVHCGIQLKKAMGIIPAGKPEGPGFYRSAMGRWLLLYVVPWPKGTTSPQAMNMAGNQTATGNWEEEKAALLHLLQQVMQQGSLHPHPMFGVLNRKDWGRLIWKHLDHHLRQFGQ